MPGVPPPATELPSLEKRPQATSFRIEDLLELVREGRLRVPSFQRGWQWTRNDITDLFDSLYRGYPVGTLLLWKRPGGAGTLSLGPHTIEVDARDDVFWVVDGQQRMIALAGVLLATANQRDDPDFDLYFNLATSTFERPASNALPAPDRLPLRKIIDAEDLFEWLDQYRTKSPAKERVQLAIRLGKLIREYEMPAYIVDAKEDVVLRHIFRRVNTAGKPLGEADVFEAIHGSASDTKPGGLREITEQLQPLGFGTFSNDLVHRSLRALLGQDAAKVQNIDLPTGVDAADALARTARALERVVQFLREDVHIPRIELLPYKMPLEVLTLFFDRHPAPSARSRQRLARWLWRGSIAGAFRGDTTTLRATLLRVEGQAENDAVTTLLRSLPKRPTPALSLLNFDFRHARSKLETLALLSRQPRNLETGEVASLSEVFSDSERRESLPLLVTIPRAAPPELRTLGQTIVNRIFHTSIAPKTLLLLFKQGVSETILQSHWLTPASIQLLVNGDLLGFLRSRELVLRKHIRDFLDARAAWEQNDRPAMTSMLILDDE